ncbi:MAG: UDP-N-acetylmuramoyl-tripeptide--D-alanyl-D-alanine ligase [Rhizobiales bacterium]|nr:UDP-N-acetylmuramoyl-tripeptide--D-alanyl-D-alanine ligase [Hyphomicrobiales bacterium]
MSQDYKINTNVSFSRLAKIINAETNFNHNGFASTICLDSRNIEVGDVFVAILGEESDGHQFVDHAIKNGAIACIISDKKKFNENKYPFLLVEDTYEALRDISDHLTKKNNALRIAITGSVGKTTTKNYLHSILKRYGKTVSSPQSFNNYLGVILSRSKVEKDTDYAIFEVGMNRKNEISKLSHLINPNIAIITNIGEAHIGNLGSKENIAIEKTKIMDGMDKEGLVIIPHDSEFYNLLINSVKQKKLAYITFGKNIKADINISKIKRTAYISKIYFNIYGKRYTFETELQNLNLIDNYMPILAVASHYNFNLDEVLKHLGSVEQGDGRWKEIVFKKNTGVVTLVDDSYNASPTSVMAAIESIDKYSNPSIKRKIIILGDMLELGDLKDGYHSQLIEFINKTSIDEVYLCGAIMKSHFENIKMQKKRKWFDAVESISINDDFDLKAGDLILLKGGNKIKLSKLVKEFINHLKIQ